MLKNVLLEYCLVSIPPPYMHDNTEHIPSRHTVECCITLEKKVSYAEKSPILNLR